MLIYANADQRTEFAGLFDQMYRLRAESFHARRSWNVKVEEGREVDQFDSLNPLYVMVVDGRGDLLASLRLLPTTGEHMLEKVFPEVMGKDEIIRHPLIWESSRFCVNPMARKIQGGINSVTRELLWGGYNAAMMAGVTQIVTVYDLLVERIIHRIGIWEQIRFNEHVYDGLKTVAGLFDVNQQVLDILNVDGRFKVASEEESLELQKTA